MTQFLFKSCVGNETWLKKLTEVSNYGKFICNISGWNTVKLGIIRAKVQFSMWILKISCSRISSICLGIVNLLVVKCRQDNSKKSALLCFCTFLCLVELRICVCLNRTRPWLELNIKFNQCSVSLSSKHWWGLITFEFI